MSAEFNITTPAQGLGMNKLATPIIVLIGLSCTFTCLPSADGAPVVHRRHSFSFEYRQPKPLVKSGSHTNLKLDHSNELQHQQFLQAAHEWGQYLGERLRETGRKTRRTFSTISSASIVDALHLDALPTKIEGYLQAPFRIVENYSHHISHLRMFSLPPYCPIPGDPNFLAFCLYFEKSYEHLKSIGEIAQPIQLRHSYLEAPYPASLSSPLASQQSIPPHAAYLLRQFQDGVDRSYRHLQDIGLMPRDPEPVSLSSEYRTPTPNTQLPSSMSAALSSHATLAVPTPPQSPTPRRFEVVAQPQYPYRTIGAIIVATAAITHYVNNRNYYDDKMRGLVQKMLSKKQS